MPSLTKYTFLFALTVAVAALTTPHVRNVLHHRSLAVRVAPLPAVPIQAVTPRKRLLGKRCRPNNGTTNTPASSSVSSSVSPSVSPSPAPSVPLNVVPDPVVTSSANPVPSPPTPATKHKDTPTSTNDVPAPSPGGFMSGPQSGDGTFYSTGLGSCGITNQDSDDICAVSKLLYDTFPGYVLGGNPNLNPVCGRSIKATFQGKSVVVKVVDRCEGCSITSIDFSPHAFNQLADPSVGRIHGMEWEWV